MAHICAQGSVTLKSYLQVINFLWIGLICKSLTNGLEGRPLTCTQKESPSGNKTKHSLSLEKLVAIVYIYNISQLSWMQVTTEFELNNSRTVAKIHVSSNKL